VPLAGAPDPTAASDGTTPNPVPTAARTPMALAALLPDMPVGCGVDRGLAHLDRFVAFSAQTLVSLSPFIIPLMIAFGWQLGVWFGVAAPLIVLAPLFGALVNAEHELQDRALLPLPREKLKAAKKASPVRAHGSHGCNGLLHWHRRWPLPACLAVFLQHTNGTKEQTLVTKYG
jgi:hypothetical protein